jgi:hypothetical protein
MDEMQLITPLEYNITTDSADIDREIPSDWTPPTQVTVTLSNTGEETIHYGDTRTAMFQLAESQNTQLLPNSFAVESLEYSEQAERWYTTQSILQTTEFSKGTLEPEESASEQLLVAAPERDSDNVTSLTEMDSKQRFDTQIYFKEQGTEPSLIRRVPVNWGFSISR